ncbi:palmitoyl-protein thioesterase, partial [Russula compacta]
MKYHSIFILASAIGALARPVQDVLPLVIWHGLGDSYDSSGILSFQSSIEKIHPGIFIHSEDQRATYYGNVDDQVEFVARQLKDVPQLSGGFDAVGFSQGGQFLRAYVERYNSPPIHNLITFGSQHMGVSDIPACKPYDILCQVVRNAARAGVYNTWAQQNLVQAQYYRDPAQLTRYLASNHFLTSINNELPHKNATYAAHFAQLDNLVLVLFTQDRTVVPKESAWFGSYAPTTAPDIEDDARSHAFNSEQERKGSDEKVIVPMREQPLYVKDWIGLRALDESGRVVFVSCDAEHMRLSVECWRPLVEQYVGSHS